MCVLLALYQIWLITALVLIGETDPSYWHHLIPLVTIVSLHWVLLCLLRNAAIPGVPSWLSWLSVWLLISAQVIISGLWDWAPHWALLPLSPDLPCTLSVSQINNLKKIKCRVFQWKIYKIHKEETGKYGLYTKEIAISRLFLRKPRCWIYSKKSLNI